MFVLVSTPVIRTGWDPKTFGSGPAETYVWFRFCMSVFRMLPPPQICPLWVQCALLARLGWFLCDSCRTNPTGSQFSPGLIRGETQNISAGQNLWTLQAFFTHQTISQKAACYLATTPTGIINKMRLARQKTAEKLGEHHQAVLWHELRTELSRAHLAGPGLTKRSTWEIPPPFLLICKLPWLWIPFPELPVKSFLQSDGSLQLAGMFMFPHYQHGVKCSKFCTARKNLTANRQRPHTRMRFVSRILNSLHEEIKFLVQNAGTQVWHCVKELRKWWHSDGSLSGWSWFGLILQKLVFHIMSLKRCRCFIHIFAEFPPSVWFGLGCCPGMMGCYPF